MSSGGVAIGLLNRPWDLAWRVVDESLRSLRDAVTAWRWRTSVPGVRDVVLDTGALPLVIDVPQVRARPLAVLLLRATQQNGASGQSISGAAITWEWRGGQVRIHAIGTLAASTRYDATIAVME